MIPYILFSYMNAFSSTNPSIRLAPWLPVRPSVDLFLLVLFFITFCTILQQIDPIEMEKLSIAASQYSVSTAGDIYRNRDKDRGGSGQRAVRDSDLWVSSADIMDILLLAGVSATTATIAECVKTLKCFLPGVPQGKLCFQVCERDALKPYYTLL